MIQGILNERFDEGIHHLQPLPEFFRRYQVLERAGSGSSILDPLNIAKSLSELGVGVPKATNASTEQKLGSSVERVPAQS